jgi:DNA helicase-2/ATP-dependent DNA helicase PcrA
MALGKALRPLAERFGEDFDGFLSSLALGVDADLWDPRANRVSLLTLHAAKGLEFPVVFIVGCEQGIVPLAWGHAGEADVDEERRLFFVGMTRARDRLYLTRAKRRLWRGTLREMERSPFLRDIEDRLLEIRKSRGGKGRRKDARVQLELF